MRGRGETMRVRGYGGGMGVGGRRWVHGEKGAEGKDGRRTEVVGNNGREEWVREGSVGMGRWLGVRGEGQDTG